nr:PREDICTED: protein Pat-like [Latimeria chalumnae]|eukprot:XP_014339679.1 PREDICTED: protein Pat-like [Latimeria chalumnae]
MHVCIIMNNRHMYVLHLDSAVEHKPFPVLDFTVPPASAPSSSNSDTVNVNPSFMPNTNQSIPNYPFTPMRRQPISTAPLNVCPHNQWTLEDIRMWPLSQQLVKEMHNCYLGRPDKFAAAVTRALVSPDIFEKWFFRVNFNGSRGKLAMPNNVRTEIARLTVTFCHQRQRWEAFPGPHQ